jgi:hypothetical protein
MIRQLGTDRRAHPRATPTASATRPRAGVGGADARGPRLRSDPDASSPRVPGVRTGEVAGVGLEVLVLDDQGRITVDNQFIEG